MQHPFISMILPNYNGGKYLRKSLESFLLQDYDNKELVIVDGKSTDRSHEIIAEFVSQSNQIIWLKEADNGISNAFNIGLETAKGDIIGYMGSDDLLYKNIFNEIAYHASWCNFDAIYFDSYTYYINEQRCVHRKCPNIPFTKESLLKYGTIVGWQNIFFKKEIYKEFRYDETNKYCMDYEFYLRIAPKNLFYLHLEYIGTINFFDNNISSDADGKQFNEACMVVQKYKGNYKGETYFHLPTSSKTNKLNEFFSKRK